MVIFARAKGVAERAGIVLHQPFQITSERN